MRLTGAERELMEFFWASEEPLPLTALEDSPMVDIWRNRSGFALATKLIKKGVLREVGAVSGATGRLTRLFAPAITREEYLSHSMDTQKWGVTLPPLVSAFLRNEPIPESELRELDALLQQAKEEVEPHD